jgi:hypothetical protein
MGMLPDGMADAAVLPAEDKTVSLVYLTSGTGNPAENARSNVARSAAGRSETAT